MKSPAPQTGGRITCRRTHRTLQTLGLALLLSPGLPALLAAEPGSPDQPPREGPPREEVVVERRVVVGGGERDRGGARDRRTDGPEAVERQLQEMREHAANLHRENRHDDAELVEREIKKIEGQRREGNRPRGRQPGVPRDGGEIGELQRRLNHLHIAMENLHAAGMPDIAMEVERRAEATRRELEERAHAGQPGPIRELEQLRREVGDLRRQLEELHRERGPRDER